MPEELLPAEVHEARVQRYGTLTGRQAQACGLLLTGMKPSEVEKVVGVTRTTLWRWRQDPAFQQAMAEAAETVLDTYRRKLVASVLPMVDVLVDVALNGERDGDRVRAATELLDRVGLTSARSQVLEDREEDMDVDDAIDELAALLMDEE